jgi:hypothetical protein
MNKLCRKLPSQGIISWGNSHRLTIWFHKWMHREAEDRSTQAGRSSGTNIMRASL